MQTLENLNPGDAAFAVLDGMRQRATVTDRTPSGGFIVQIASNPIAGQNGGPARFDAKGRYMGNIRGYHLVAA